MFQPRVVLHGTFNDVDVEVPANDVSLDIEVIDSIATVTSEVTFANAVGGLVYALYLPPTSSSQRFSLNFFLIKMTIKFLASNPAVCALVGSQLPLSPCFLVVLAFFDGVSSLMVSLFGAFICANNILT